MSSKPESYYVAHLLRRAGFGADADELKYYTTLGYDRTVDELLNPEKTDNKHLDEVLDKEEFDFTNLYDTKRWWIYRMAFTRRPLEEKMVLFWHSHFATSNQKVGNAYLMYEQNELFRKNAMGRFGDLLLAVSKDPAMIKYLDNNENRKGKPNENYAREVMELFTMGIGNYSEQDIKEAARAFTGWHAPNGFYFNKKAHDSGEKTVLGLKGNLNGDDVVALLAKQDATAKRLSRKLITFYCTDVPNDKMVQEVADAYLNNDQNIRSMLKAIFTHKRFLEESSYHCKIKSPTELVVGTLKSLTVKKIDGDLPNVMSRMGQNLFEPPSVKGWDGGMAWVATDTMMERFNFAERISTQKFDSIDGYIVPAKIAQKHGLTSNEDVLDYFLSVLVDGDVPKSSRAKLLSYLNSDLQGKEISKKLDDKTSDAKMRGLIHLVMTLPSYQLA